MVRRRRPVLAGVGVMGVVLAGWVGYRAYWRPGVVAVGLAESTVAVRCQAGQVRWERVGGGRGVAGVPPEFDWTVPARMGGADYEMGFRFADEVRVRPGWWERCGFRWSEEQFGDQWVLAGTLTVVGVPGWVPLAVAGPVGVWGVVPFLRRRGRPGRCRRCGYDVRVQVERGGRCPECGEEVVGVGVED